MAITTAKKLSTRLGPDSAGAHLTPRQFDRADFEDGWRYELINGVLIASPIPSEQEADPNEELGHLLRTYRDTHSDGKALDSTLGERIVATGDNRRRADRVIWCGLGRKPRQDETPTIVVEFVSPGKCNLQRDYEDKRDEYLNIGVKEYWIIDRFARKMTVYSKQGERTRKQTVKERQTYTTPLLPGFELPLASWLAVADDWES